MSDIKVQFSALVCSKRNSGKSVLVKYILCELLKAKKIASAVVFSNTAEYSDDWCCLPKENRVQGFDEVKLRRIIDAQKAKKSKILEGGKATLPQVLLIFDDVAGMDDFKASTIIEEIYANSRHWGISVITLVQYANFLTPACRGNADYIYIGINGENSLESLYKIVIYSGGNKKDFKRFVGDNTKDFFMIRYNNLIRDGNRWSKVKAPLVKFKVRCKNPDDAPKEGSGSGTN
jgi:hypothetical protein